ncbi:MAG: DnaJ domain-containing protein [Proteobacteria bacterium]|nr:DnaJ domain-containing protein [Pseudomonadota bacterium]
MAVKRDPFKILGIDRTKYTDAELKQTYLNLVKKYNPEKRPEKFEEIRSAYNTLKNARSPYDILAISPVEMIESNLSRTELAAKIEDELGIQKQKISFKKGVLLKKLEEIVNDFGN